MNIKKSIYYYTSKRNLKKNLPKIALVIIIFAIIIPTGVSTYDNINNNLKVPEYLEIGDLIFCDLDMDFIKNAESLGMDFPYIFTQQGVSNDHIAMYIGNNKFIEASPYHYNPKDGKLYGVVVSHIGLIKLWGKNIIYARINASKEQKENAVNWAVAQIGQPYQSDYINKNSNPYDESDKYSDEWYCTEIIWAAYKNQGISLDKNIEGAVSIDDIQQSNKFSFYEKQKDNSKINVDITLLINCLFDLEEDKENF